MTSSQKGFFVRSGPISPFPFVMSTMCPSRHPQLAPLLFDTMVTTMTVVRAFNIRRHNGGSSSRLIQTFLREGVFYYILISIANLVSSPRSFFEKIAGSEGHGVFCLFVCTRDFGDRWYACRSMGFFISSVLILVSFRAMVHFYLMTISL